MKQCDVCGGEEGVVVVAGKGKFCPEHYKAVKRMKAAAESVRLPRCENCGSGAVVQGRCLRCGNHLNSDGSVIRVGGYPDC